MSLLKSLYIYDASEIDEDNDPDYEDMTDEDLDRGIKEVMAAKKFHRNYEIFSVVIAIVFVLVFFILFFK